MESDMDEDMEDTFEEEEEEEEGFHEVKADEKVDFDFDYEFDAPKYFDFTQEKLNLETREAESWFINADTYPPSPFVLKLNLEGNATTQNVNTSPKPKDAERSDPTGSHSVTDMNTNISQMDDNCRGLTFYNHMAQDIHTHPKSKHATKTSLFKSSTLMKPTASQLAKQNRRVVHGSSRILERPQTSLLQQNQKSLENLVIETQAAKRQKLEGGHLPKVVDSKQQTSLIHKMSKRGGPVDGNSVHTKLKLTIPRQPDLETAHRAQRIRPKTKNSTELGEQVMPTTSMFKARRLNRKILEAPSLPLPKKSTPRLPEFQEFHLKTSERAMQHSIAASSASLHPNKQDKVVGNTKASLSARSGMGDSMSCVSRPTCVDAPKQEGCETINKFRARPFNKKIFSSKGDIGVFRNTKRETTVPMEFNFSTNKKYNPPLELFDKLSLTSELQQKTGSQPKLPRPTHLPNKGSKENTVDTFQQEQRIMHAVKDNSQRFGGKQIQCKVDGEINEIGSRANMRSLGIR